MAKNWKSPLHRFHSQKSAAKSRSVAWELTFEEWWKIWRDSGKWEQRGCKRGQYCMARHNDIGSYAVGNVAIIEAGANGSAALKNWPAKKAEREAAEASAGTQ